jgi:hypothetical protein
MQDDWRIPYQEHGWDNLARSLMNQVLSNSRLKQSSGLLCRKRMDKIVALSLAAPVALEELELLTGFHPLCNYRLFQIRTNVLFMALTIVASPGSSVISFTKD